MSDTNGLPAGWCQTVLGVAVEIHDDLREPVNAEERAKRLGSIPYYGATGQVGWINNYLMDGEYVLLAEDGAPFFDPHKPKAYRVEGKAWVNNHAHVLRGIEGVTDNRYLMFSLNRTDYRGYANGTTRLKLTQAAMRRLPIRLAPINEQRRIVAKIEELFSDLVAGVAALKRIKANLKRYRAAVLKAAVEGRLTEEWRAKHPKLEPATKLLGRILAERRQKWEEGQFAKFAAADKTPPKGWREKYAEPAGPDTSGLHELPQGWCWTTVDTIAFVTKLAGFEYTKYVKYDSDGDLAVIKAENAGKHGFKRTDFSRVKSDTVKHLTRSRLHPGDLLMVFVGVGVGQVAKVPSDQPYFLGPNIATIKIECSHLLAGFAEHYFRSSLGFGLAMSFAKAVAQPSLSMGTIRQIPILIPPLIEQEHIVTEVDRLLSVIAAAEAQVDANLKRAARLRQSILKRAFEGRLVPQDSTDEPADKLLERIRQERAAANGSGAPRTRRRRTSKHQAEGETHGAAS
ncbi:MAG: restriction endonuclease subunit S [Gaiellaceae bacterium]